MELNVLEWAISILSYPKYVSNTAYAYKIYSSNCGQTLKNNNESWVNEIKSWIKCPILKKGDSTQYENYRGHSV